MINNAIGLLVALGSAYCLSRFLSLSNIPNGDWLAGAYALYVLFIWWPERDWWDGEKEE
jgi:hypothetical protein